MYSNQMQVKLPGPLRHPSAADASSAHSQRHKQAPDSISSITHLLQSLVAHQTGAPVNSPECVRKAEYLQRLLDARVETSWSLEHQIKDRLKEQVVRLHKNSKSIQRDFAQTKLDDLVRKLTSRGTNNFKILKVLAMVSESRFSNPSQFSSRGAANPSIMANLQLENLDTNRTLPTLSYQSGAVVAATQHQTLKVSVTVGLLRFLRDCASLGEVQDCNQGLFSVQVTDSIQDDPFQEYGIDQDFVDQLSKQRKDHGKEKKQGPLLSMKLSNLLPTVEIRCAVTPALETSEWMLLVELLKIGAHLSIVKDFCDKNMGSNQPKSKIKFEFVQEIMQIMREAREYFDSLLEAESIRCEDISAVPIAFTAGTHATSSTAASLTNLSHLAHSLHAQLVPAVLGTATSSPTTLLSLYTTLSPVAPTFASLLQLVEACVCVPAVHVLSVLCTVHGTGDELVKRVLGRTVKPFVEACIGWMQHGVVLAEQKEDGFVRGGGDKPLWEEESWVDWDAVPALLDGDAAKLIYQIGRTRALERRMGFRTEKAPGMMDIEESADIDAVAWSRVEKGLHELAVTRNIEALKTDLASFGRERDRRLLSKYQDKSGILSHLSFLKKTMFMKRGDVIDNLIKAAASVLDLPAKDVYFHNIMPLFDDVIQKSNLRNTPDQALGVKLLEPGQGDTGWDIFCIEYKFPEYLQHIFNPQISLKLLRLWHHLFKLKRCSTKLSEVWLELRLLNKLSRHNSSMEHFVNELNNYRNNMSEFLANLSSYIFTEVIENQLDKFMKDVAKVESLEELKLKTHNLVDNMLIGAFLERDPLDLYRSISFLLNSCFRFCKAFAVATQYCLLEVDERGKVIVKDPNERLAALQVERKIKKYKLSDTFPIESFATMTRKIWEEYHRSYLRFLVRLNLTPQTRTFSFKFDFNQYHCNSNFELIDKVFQEEKLKVFPKN